MIIIVDYGMGNVGSVFNMLRKIGGKARVSKNIDDMARAEKLILPGVGHFDRGMGRLADAGLLPVLSEQVLHRKKPILGICLGMQMMTRASEEGSLPGLGWVGAETRRFLSAEGLRVPHMGWNTVRPCGKPTLFDPAPPEPERFYFVHSYYVALDRQDDMAASCAYGSDFAAAYEVENIFGVQFHPEKSHSFGMALFRRFLAL